VLAGRGGDWRAAPDLRPDIYPPGLQDDVPFRPAAVLAGPEGEGADETRDFLQPDAEWPVDGAAGESASKKKAIA
jgi:hypothetical protein